MSVPKICLVNMPFASPEAPSLALTQLKAVLEERFDPGEISVEILYLDLDFLEFTGGLSNYLRMTTGQGRLSGAADWFFREAAFPEAPDNTESYLERFYFDDEDEEIVAAREFITEMRPRAGKFLDTLIDRHRLDQATIVGFTALFFQTMASFAMARKIKERQPGIVTVIGGAACETDMGLEFARRVEAIDYVFSGPALVSFPGFVERQLAGDLEGCERIDGVFSKTNLATVSPGGCTGNGAAPDSGGVRITGPERNINERVPLDYRAFLDHFERAIPGDKLRPMLLFETSRGCSWGEKIACTFCGLNGMAMHYRSMTPENALAQIGELYANAPQCRFFLAVDTIVPDDYVSRVFPKLNTPPQTALMYEVRPRMTEEELAALCDAGVLVIQPGIEALSTATLKLMRKGTTAFGNLAFLKRCSRHPLRVEWNLLIGSPGETEATWEKYLDDIPRLVHLPPPGGAFPISFDRFSQYFNRPAEWQLELEPHEFYRYAYPFEPDSLANIAYHFVDTGGSQASINPWLDRLNAAVGEWWTRWENRDGREAAQLCLVRDGGDTFVYDSRSGEPSHQPAGEITIDLLRYLETPRREDAVTRRFGEADAARELASLRERSLLFEEDERIMSLLVT